MRRTRGTASVPGVYIEFQAAVLRALPRDLPDGIALKWARNGEMLERALREALSPGSGSAFPACRTVAIGTLRDVKSLKKSLEEFGFRVGDRAADIMAKPGFVLAPEETDINLVPLSVAEIGFPNGATLEEIYARARERGLDLCPAEVGPQFRIQYGDQPPGEALTIAMELIVDSNGHPSLFHVTHDSGVRLLSTYWSSLDDVWRGDSLFLFASPSTRA